MSLPHLPLELIRHIIHFACETSDDEDVIETGCLKLRTVSRFFDYEIVNACLKNANWYLDPRDMDRHQNLQVPDSFAGAHLHMKLGTHDPKVSKLVSSLYAAADILLEQFGQAGLYCSPEMAVRDVFRAVVRVRLENLRSKLFYEYDRPEPPMEPPERTEAMKTAFVVAAAMGHEKIVRQMLHSGEIAPNAWSESLHSPLPPAIRHGYANMTNALLEFGFEIPSRPFGDDCHGPRGDLYTAVVTAAKNGHIGALEPLLKRDITKELTHCVLDFAARFKHWNLVVQILDHHLTRDQWEITLTRKNDIPWVTQPVEYKVPTAQEVVLWAARDGKDDLLLKLLQNGLTARSNVTGTKLFPLQQAAEGGHLSTCQLILDNGALDIHPDYIGETHIRNRIDTLAIAVAKGGNTDILRLFKKVGLWSRTSALHILPVAAEYGNLGMAKYVVEHGMDMPVKSKTLPQEYLHHSQSNIGELCLHCKKSFYRQNLRRLALLRAVAFGHTDVVRWLVRDLDVDPNAGQPDDYPWAIDDNDTAPLEVAIDTENLTMARVLKFELGARDLLDGNRSDYLSHDIYTNGAYRRLSVLSIDLVRGLQLGRKYRDYKIGDRRWRSSRIKKVCAVAGIRG